MHTKLDALFNQNQTLLELVNGLKIRCESDVWKDAVGTKVFDMDELLGLRTIEIPIERAENEPAVAYTPVAYSPVVSETDHLSPPQDVGMGSSLELNDGQDVGEDPTDGEPKRYRKRDSSRYTFVRRKLSAHQQRAEEQSIRQRSQYSENSKETEEQLSFRDRVGQMVASHYFSFFIMALILVNLVLLGIEVDVSASLGQDDVPRWFEIVNFVIVSIFMLELILKMYARGCRSFFDGEDGPWNVFDLCIVVVSLLESVISSQLELSHLRVMRFARLVKTLRGVRVMRLLHYISALRTLARSILNTMRSLFWTLVLLVLTFYSFALIFTQELPKYVAINHVNQRVIFHPLTCAKHLFTRMKKLRVAAQAVLDHCRIEAVTETGNPNAVPMCASRLNRYWSSVPQSLLR